MNRLEFIALMLSPLVAPLKELMPNQDVGDQLTLEDIRAAMELLEEHERFNNALIRDHERLIIGAGTRNMDAAISELFTGFNCRTIKVPYE